MNPKHIAIGVAGVAILGLGTFVVINSTKQSDTTNDQPKTTITTTVNPSQSATPVVSLSPSATATTTQNGYKDGTYSASSSYFSPGGQEQVAITVTLKQNVVSAVTFKGTTDNSTSARYQKLFSDNFKSEVEGKKVDEVNVGFVSGSSLTSQGFNAALTKIKAQAQM